MEFIGSRSGKIITLLVWSIFLLGAGKAQAQQPFDLDTTFRTSINAWYVNSLLPLNDGSILVSGRAHYPGDPVGSFRMLSKLFANGQLDTSFPEWTPGGGKLVLWDDQFYIGSHTVRRILMNGEPDPSFIHMNSGPYFSSFQGGDYHVYPDGRVLMSGVHALSDTIRGFTGDHCLIWFSNEGYLDTTNAQHRKCGGALDYFQQLPDGRFIGSGYLGTWEGEPVSNLVRLHSDGALDPSFQVNMNWGQAYGFLPLEDGRVYVAGLFKIEGIADTLHLVRFMPDGSLDPSFNNTNRFRLVELSGWSGIPSFIHPHDSDKLIVVGGFELVENESRRGICMFDTSGQLIMDEFVNAGCGNYNYNDFVHGSLAGLSLTADGNYYVWGAYHGYNDGTTNDTLQRFISRLYGPHVGINEESIQRLDLNAWPNPGAAELNITWNSTNSIQVRIEIHSMLGQLVRSSSASVPPVSIDTSDLPAGCYSIQVIGEQRSGTIKWLKQ